jgi:hypothetical protein
MIAGTDVYKVSPQRAGGFAKLAQLDRQPPDVFPPLIKYNHLLCSRFDDPRRRPKPHPRPDLRFENSESSGAEGAR